MVTRDQRRAQNAFRCVSKLASEKDEYARFSKSFPALIHSAGLAQAIAYAESKAPSAYKSDLAEVSELQDLAKTAREAPLGDYQRYTREVLAAAGWLKRYAEALLE